MDLKKQNIFQKYSIKMGNLPLLLSEAIRK